MSGQGSKIRLRVGEKGVLAALALVLLAFSAIAQTRIFEGRAVAITAQSWQSEIGFYLPFVLFALVSTYHFLEWARKHKRQALVMMLFIVAVASIIGTAAVKAPRPMLSTPTPQQISSTSQQSVGPVVQVPQQPISIQDSLHKLREALNSTPYFSTTFDALMLFASALAVVAVLIKLRREKRGYIIKPATSPRVTTVEAKTPREVILRCYQLACASLQNSGLSIPDSDTPSDVCLRAKQVRPMLSDPLGKLTLLFEEAKFSIHSISEEQADQASGCYVSISESILGMVQK